ncbi:hypothetical protein GS634_21950 [Ruegeria atlantica]|uniref:Uncharacterized protein n=1 Tax=Ruegeria atlantica TaxID=81569 RepID=A0AA91BVQ5_9RHOB|nr:hypothetical protein [Ruegeria atlantica]NOE20803.1 hypothetical protein [Ruegeria atlantica]
MKDRPLTVSDILIVTGNFVEATDIREALSPLDATRIQHLREINDAAHLLLDSGFCPQLSIISYTRADLEFAGFVTRLQALDCTLLLIDAPDAIAAEYSANVLKRPFSTEDFVSMVSLL